MTNTREDLNAMTAKALRPIAADLGITGASRMRKDDLISAIIAAEDTAAAKSEGDIADFDEEAVYAQRHVAKDLTGMVHYGSAPEQQTPKADNSEVRAALTPPKFKADDLIRITVGERSTVVKLIDLDPSGGPGFAWMTKIAEHEADPRFSGVTFTEDFLSQPFCEKIEAPQTHAEMHHRADGSCVFDQCPEAPANEYYARTTRRGVETVVHCGERDGRTFFRYIDAKTGRRSSITARRTDAFEREYVKVSS